MEQVQGRAAITAYVASSLSDILQGRSPALCAARSLVEAVADKFRHACMALTYGTVPTVLVQYRRYWYCGTVGTAVQAGTLPV